MSKWIKNTGVKPNVGGRVYEVKFLDGFTCTVQPNDVRGELDWSFEDTYFAGDVGFWRFVDEKPVDKELTQAEVQQLLHILRGQLDVVSFYKDVNKIDAAELWEECDKKDKFTAISFAAYSHIYASYKQHKQEEKKLVSLITKLKGLK